MVEWFEDLLPGMRFTSEPVKISEDEIKNFAAQFDPRHFHLDERAAQQTFSEASRPRVGILPRWP